MILLDYTVRQISLRYPNGREIHYDYGAAGGINDVFNRLDSIVDDDNVTVLSYYDYQGAGRVVSEDYQQPQVKLDLSDALDRHGRVLDQIWSRYGQAPDTLDSISHTCDRAGNRLALDNALNTVLSEIYSYDAVDELIGSARGDGRDQNWTMDGLGNWSEFDDDGTTQTRTHNEANEVTAVSGSVTPTHDAAGNMTTFARPGDPSTAQTAKYDAWNHLVEVHEGDTLIARYNYDATGRRILKQLAGGIQIHSYHNGQQTIETRDENGTPLNQFVWSQRYIDSLILRDSFNGSGELVPASRLFYLADAYYNVTALVDTSGQIVERYNYDAYGRVTYLNADFTIRTGSAFANPTLYTGRELDPETNLFFYRARYYHTDLGKFIARDFALSTANVYCYCNNNALKNVDPSGQIVRPDETKGQFERSLFFSSDCYMIKSHYGRIVINRLEMKDGFPCPSKKDNPDFRSAFIGTILHLYQKNKLKDGVVDQCPDECPVCEITNEGIVLAPWSTQRHVETIDFYWKKMLPGPPKYDIYARRRELDEPKDWSDLVLGLTTYSGPCTAKVDITFRYMVAGYYGFCRKK